MVTKYLITLSSYLESTLNASSLYIYRKFVFLLDKSQHNLHRCVAAYISDTYLLSTALMTIPGDKYGITMMTSLDHSLWFHSHFSADQWMLYECECPRMSE